MNDPFKQDILDDALTARQLERKKKREPKKEKKAEKEARREERQRIADENRAKRVKFAAVVFAVLAVLAIIFGKDFKQIMDLRKQKAEAQAKLDAINEKIAQLEDELSRIQSPEYIIQQARNQLRMIYPGEVLYVVLDDGQNK